MSERAERLFDRRTVLAGLGASAGLALTGGAGLWHRADRGEVASLPPDAALARLHASLSEGQKRILYLPADHPTRQVTNTVALFKAPHLGTVLDAEQLALVERIYRTMTSARGHAALANTVGLEAGGLDGCVLTLYGRPDRVPEQLMISGAHVLLRSGGLGELGYALGGPIAYGQQIGNRRFRVEGNAFAWHSDAANAFYARLPAATRERSLTATPPQELVVQVLGAEGPFTGLAVAGLPDDARESARALVDTVLSSYPDEDRAQAWSCIEDNGGLDALHVTFYRDQGYYADGAVYAELSEAERATRPLPYWQVWRVEGPGTVIHFKGHPHVHAYVNIVRDPARQNVGEVLGEVPRLLEGDALRPLLLGALRAETGEPLAFYGDDISARLCPGEVTSGSAWALDPYGERVVVASVPGRGLAEPARAALAAQGEAIGADRVYRLATVDYYTRRPDVLGEVGDLETSDSLLRDSIVAHLRAGALG